MQVAEEKPITVAITYPSQDQVMARFAQSLACMVNATHSQGFPGLAAIGILNTQSSVLPNARNELTEQAMAHGFSHQLWVDSDMEFPSNTLLRLLAHRKDVVGINAVMRRPPFKTTVEVTPGVMLETNPDSTGLEKVHRMGTGLMLVDLDVVRRIRKRPLFTFEWIGGQNRFRGEDVVFCQRLRKAGAALWVDQDLSKEVGHVGTYSYRPVYPVEKGTS